MNSQPSNGRSDVLEPDAPDSPGVNLAVSSAGPDVLTPPDNIVGLNDPSSQKPQKPERRSHSKIGRLPKAARDQLNCLVRDGTPYEEIPALLGDQARHITARNVSSWHSGPHHQRWLLEQEWLENLRTDQESAFDLCNDFDDSKFNQATLQLALTRLFLAFRHIDSGDLNQKLGGNAQAFARLVHALARACHENTNIEKYRAVCAKSQAAELKQLDHDRDLSDKELELLVNKMDQVFKVRRRPPLAAPDPRDGGLAAPKQSNGGLGKQLGQGEEAFPPIQNQKSQIENPERRPSKILPRRKNEHSQIRNADSEPRQNSEIENGKKQSPEGSVRSESVPPKIENQKTRNQHSNARGRSSNRKSKFTKIENAAKTSPSLPLEERVGERRSSERVPEIKNQKSEIENAPGPEPCHFCHTDLPALLPDGERPLANCQSCGITLHSPHNRHLYCPACASDLRMIIVEGQRTLSTCPYCDAPLPPWLPPTG